MGELLLILIVAHTALAKPTIAVTLCSWSFAISISGRNKWARICSGNLFRCHRLVRLTHPSSRGEPSHHTLVRQHMSGVVWAPFHASDRKDRHYWLFTVPLGSGQPLAEGKWGECEYNIWHKFTFNLCHRTPTYVTTSKFLTTYSRCVFENANKLQMLMLYNFEARILGIYYSDKPSRWDKIYLQWSCNEHRFELLNIKAALDCKKERERVFKVINKNTGVHFTKKYYFSISASKFHT